VFTTLEVQLKSFNGGFRIEIGVQGSSPGVTFVLTKYFSTVVLSDCTLQPNSTNDSTFKIILQYFVIMALCRKAVLSLVLCGFFAPNSTVLMTVGSASLPF
jgi:hypothetical protein